MTRGVPRHHYRHFRESRRKMLHLRDLTCSCRSRQATRVCVPASFLTGEMAMAEIKVSKGTALTKEVQEAIEKKLKELEEQGVREGTNIKISQFPALGWLLSYSWNIWFQFAQFISVHSNYAISHQKTIFET